MAPAVEVKRKSQKLLAKGVGMSNTATVMNTTTTPRPTLDGSPRGPHDYRPLFDRSAELVTRNMKGFHLLTANQTTTNQ